MIMEGDVKAMQCWKDLEAEVDRLRAMLEDTMMRVHILERAQDPSQYQATEKKGENKVDMFRKSEVQHE